MDQLDAGWAEKFKILADANRLAIIDRLLQRESSAGALSEALAIEQTLLSHHLKVLREAGFVTSRREGKNIIYQLSADLHCAANGPALDLGCCQITFQPDTRR
ncbi:MAG: metalloregulator ArsR/SmtB family transcription factor [Desulfuromonadales bacterium]|nr:metalloregulator ArsR/SmtB family transcription factor [Desulfuromonadales bacterium]